MSITLGRNIAAMSSERFLDRASSDVSTSFERLSSGMRINRASDDAAGLAIADSLRVDARVRNVALRNVNDGISMLSIVDSTLNNQSQILTRLSELAESSANGVYSDTQRLALSREYRQLVDEFGRVGDGAIFNGIRPMLSGRGGNTTSILFQAGVNGSTNSTLRVGLSDYGTRSGVLDFALMPLQGVDINTGGPDATIDELSSFYGGQMIATSVTINGKSYDILLGAHQDDAVIGSGGMTSQGIVFDVYGRSSDMGGQSSTTWQSLVGTPTTTFVLNPGTSGLTTGTVVGGISAGTVTGLTAGAFNLNGMDISGLKLGSSTGAGGFPPIASLNSTSLLDLSGVESAARARTALDLLKTKRDELANYRGVVGAMQSRLHTASSLLLSSREQSLAAESRIRDVDVAGESANFVAAQIRQQASVAVLANVRSQQRLVLQLL